MESIDYGSSASVEVWLPAIQRLWNDHQEELKFFPAAHPS